MARKLAARHKRRKPRIHRHSAPGAAPGTLLVAPGARRTTVHVMAYNEQQLVEFELSEVDQIRPLLAQYSVIWINVEGLADTRLIARIGELFELHALALEDVVNVHQRPKIDPYLTHLFIVTHMLRDLGHLETEQVSIFLGRNYLITFQQKPGDCFDPIRDRLRHNVGRLRKTGPDYLTYSMLDAIIDAYFPVVERFADSLDRLEDQLAGHSSPNILDELHHVRHNLLLLRRTVSPQRDSLSQLLRDEHPLFTEETRVFLRDCHDHTFQLMELLEVYREICLDLRDCYLSHVSNRMNEIMKLLTVIATVFMPLSFIASLYGMNFDPDVAGNMPELRLPYAYPVVLLGMVLLSLGMLYCFRRQNWIGPLRKPAAGNGQASSPRERKVAERET